MLALIFLIPLCVSIAAAAAIKRQDGVICETVHIGAIRIFSNDQAARYLPDDGANVTFFTPEPSEPPFLIEGGNTALYEFQECTSSFMGYPGVVVNGTTIVTYGHIVPLGYGGCLTTNLPTLANPDGNYYTILNETCSTSDDDSQLLQYWSLTYGDRLMRINFVGRTADGTTYNTSALAEMLPQLDFLSNEQAVTIAAYTEPSFILYSLRFTD
ncbi:hypothetical protein BKA93DRAFT_881515 [Sparassis latifolia]